jgi:hypothetical protein
LVIMNSRVIGLVALGGAIAVAVLLARGRAETDDAATDPASVVASSEVSASRADRRSSTAEVGDARPQVVDDASASAIGDGHGGFPDDWRDGIDPPEGLAPARVRAFYEQSLAHEERLAARLERALAESPSRDDVNRGDALRSIELELAVAKARRDEVKRRLEQLP